MEKMFYKVILIFISTLCLYGCINRQDQVKSSLNQITQQNIESQGKEKMNKITF